jgi:hypothetical protein
MSFDPASQLNLSACEADFSYAITVNTIEIQGTGKGTKSLADDLEAVLRKIEGWHQGSIVGFKISYRDTEGLEHEVPIAINTLKSKSIFFEAAYVNNRWVGRP